MSHLIYYNIFICWVITIVAIITGGFIIKKSQNRYDRSFGFFWFFFGILWFFVGLSLFAWKLGSPAWSRYFFYIDQVFVPLHIMFIADYLFGVTFRNKRANNIFLSINAFLGILFLTLLFALGPESLIVSDWSIKFKPPFFVFYLVLFLIVEGGVLLTLDIVNNLKGYFKTKRKNFLARILVDFSFILYVVAGALDESGNVSGWPLLAIRIIMVLAAMIGFLAFSAIDEYNAAEVG